MSATIELGDEPILIVIYGLMRLFCEMECYRMSSQNEYFKSENIFTSLGAPIGAPK